MATTEKITSLQPMTDHLIQPQEAKSEMNKKEIIKDNVQLTNKEQKALSEELYQKLLLSYQWNDFFFYYV